MVREISDIFCSMKTMTKEEAALWERLSAFQIDASPEAVLRFESRLARENGWDLGKARRAVEEYKKFLFLGVTAEHTVTPSEEVDQVWHLHLVYTHSY